MTIYVLHLAIIAILRNIPATSDFLTGSHAVPVVAASLVVGALGAMALGTTPVARATAWLTRPKIDRWIVTVDEAGVRRG
jgi:hypothetical protein